MTNIRKALVAVALGSLAIGGSALRAQPVGDAPDQTNQNAPDQSDQDAPDQSDQEVTAPIEKSVNLSPGEMQARSEVYLKDMQKVLVRVVELQQLARKQKDVIKLNCVNDKLLQVKQLLNIAEGGRTDMVEAIAQQDEDSSLHQFSQISIAKEKAESLHSEAEGCIGEELVFLGPTEITVDEGNVTDDPTTDDDLSPGDDILDPPGYASPFS